MGRQDAPAVALFVAGLLIALIAAGLLVLDVIEPGPAAAAGAKPPPGTRPTWPGPGAPGPPTQTPNTRVCLPHRHP